MKVLSIGNSFSQDAQRYLNRIAVKNNKSIKCVNLYIGGCSLKNHYYNILDDAKAYNLEFNGCDTGFRVSIKEALQSDDWDFITIQQASKVSFDFEKYYTPYIEKLAEYIRVYAPKSKIIIHQTWPYKDGSELLNSVGFLSTEEMFKKVQLSYRKAAEVISADGIIPSGAAMFGAYKKDRDIVHRDTFHASLGFGRYMIGLLWFLCIFGKGTQIRHLDYFDMPMSKEEMEFAEKIARNYAVEL